MRIEYASPGRPFCARLGDAPQMDAIPVHDALRLREPLHSEPYNHDCRNKRAGGRVPTPRCACSRRCTRQNSRASAQKQYERVEGQHQGKGLSSRRCLPCSAVFATSTTRSTTAAQKRRKASWMRGDTLESNKVDHLSRCRWGRNRSWGEPMRNSG